jgi:hypothetical protein
MLVRPGAPHIYEERVAVAEYVEVLRGRMRSLHNRRSDSRTS